MTHINRLDVYSIGLLVLSAGVVSQAPACRGRLGGQSALALTVTLPTPIPDPLDPPMEVGEHGEVDAVFEAWAVGELKNRSQHPFRAKFQGLRENGD